MAFQKFNGNTGYVSANADGSVRACQAGADGLINLTGRFKKSAAEVREIIANSQTDLSEDAKNYVLSLTDTQLKKVVKQFCRNEGHHVNTNGSRFTEIYFYDLTVGENADLDTIKSFLAPVKKDCYVCLYNTDVQVAKSICKIMKQYTVCSKH